ncbi:Rab GDP dissociation inhibitor [Cryptosporidium ryanae]|uniref:Rab GDP dissociation inhibitor n=1 Tax=Cryptosporidium ryanae TaxID=515981 RepID=UPI00351A0EA6|nr:Rab GDP dissociation inhibitor [Cryptosporidium ryanae]
MNEGEVWDAVIMGTGLPECIVASGLSLRGYKVLVIDENLTYGGVWNTVKYKSFSDWMFDKGSENNCSVFDSSYFYGKRFESSQGDENTNRIMIDLLPKVLFSRGKLTELVISCNITNYLDFQGIENVYYCELKSKGEGESDSLKEHKNNELLLLKTPFSKSDIFSSNDLSLVEKRQIMRLYNGLKDIIELRSISERKLDIDLINDPFRSPALISDSGILREEERTSDKVEFELFSEFQDKWKINEKVLNLIKHNASFIINKNKDEFDSKNDFEKYLSLLLSSLNQHGCTGTPFIYPCYGICDLTQAFSRLAAVKGALQRLGTKIMNMRLVNGVWNLDVKGENLPTETIKCRLLISSYKEKIKDCFSKGMDGRECSDFETINETGRSVICVVAILNGPLSILGENSESNKISVITLNVKDRDIEKYRYNNVVSVLQCNSHTGCCSDRHYIVYLNMVIEDEKKENIEEHRNYMYHLLDCLVFSKKNTSEIISRASYFYKQKLDSPKLLSGASVLFLPDPCINNNSFLLLDEDVEKSLIALECSLCFLNPRSSNNLVSHKNFYAT